MSPEQAIPINLLADMIRSGRSLEEACRELSRWISPEIVQQARREYQERIQKVRVLKDPPEIVNPNLESWYPGPMEGDRFWPALLDFLISKGWATESIGSIDQASTKIVSRLGYPGTATFSTRGLVIGYVQSGKTANFTAVIAKAADVRYRFVIVLSGLTNKLRRQTQERLDRELIELNPDHWVCLTGRDYDFAETQNVNPFLADHTNLKTLCVIKKNPSRLRRLVNWLRGAHEQNLRNCPVLVIDDEADQASVNTAQGENVKSAIHALLTELLAMLPKAAYVGYTATPFANVFIDPLDVENLYPRDFIIALPKPADYFGPEALFGRERLSEEDALTFDGLNVIRTIEDEEVPCLRPSRNESFTPGLVPSLQEALYYFWLATAARFSRGQADQHSTMLIHTSQRTAVHLSFRPLLDNERTRVLSLVRAGNSEFMQKSRVIWERELEAGVNGDLQRQTPPVFLPEVRFEDLVPYLAEVLDKTDIVMENYLAAPGDRLDFSGPPKVSVVVGGDILSRGLTLEGLVVSYFVRSASAYDTLLQMGRWFGFRKGYEDLPRIWLTTELRGFFYDLAAVEQEIRLDSRRYDLENLTPLDFAIRVRTHPQMSITSRLKMGSAVEAEISYSLKAVQTRLFWHRDAGWLENNIKATRALFGRISAEASSPRDLAPDRAPSGRYLFRGVAVEDVLQFLAQYCFHENSTELRSDLLIDYIRREVEECGLLQTWNVGFLGLPGDQAGGSDLSGLIGVNRFSLVSRAKLKGLGTRYADIKALMSRADLFCDTGLGEAETRGLQGEKLRLRRSEVIPGEGLLLVYPISKLSKPSSAESKTREPLQAVKDVIGVALVFPESGVQRPLKYFTADLSEVPRDEFVLPEEADLE
jgi:hypothetical protein